MLKRSHIKSLIIEQLYLLEIIEKTGPQEYTLYSKKKDPKTGKRKSLGKFKSKEAAKKREREIQYFKNIKESKKFLGNEFLKFKELVQNSINQHKVAKELGFNKIGSGAFRVTYEIPNSEFVLKISKDDNFYNKVEANNSMNTKYSDLFPKVYDAAKDFSWILSERVKVIATVERFLDFFPEIGFKFRNKLLEINNPLWLIQVALAMNIQSYASFKDVENSAGFIPSRYLRKKDKFSGFNKLYKRLKSSKLFNRISDVASEFNIDVFDIDIGNAGIATRENKEYFVILDASIFK